MNHPFFMPVKQATSQGGSELGSVFRFVAGRADALFQGFNAVDQHLKGMHEFAVITFESFDPLDQLGGGFLRQGHWGWRHGVARALENCTVCTHVQLQELIQHLAVLYSLSPAEFLEALAGWREKQGTQESSRSLRRDTWECSLTREWIRNRRS